MASTVVARVGLDDSGFQEGVSKIQRSLKVVQSEFAAASAKLGDFGKSTEGLRLKADSLNRQMELQNEKVAALTRSYQESVEKKGEDAKATENLKIKLNYAIDELGRMQQELSSTTEELNLKSSAWYKLSESMNQAGETLKTVGEKISSVGKTLATAVTLPIVGIGTAATKMAMDAVESENLFEVAMGGMADEARRWSEETSKALGLNAYNVRNNMATYNAMLTSMGLASEESLKMSEGLTKLSYDMASFYNLKPEEAFDKLKSGISGEAEPLKELGILVNDTTIKTYALTHGIIQQGQELTEAQKVQARYGAIMEATKNAQGDLARTLDSPTNKLRIMKEQAAQIGIEFGQILLPILEKLIAVVKPLMDRFQGLNQQQQELIVKIALVAAALGPVIMIIGTLASAIGSVATLVGTVSGAVAVVTTGAAAATPAIGALATAFTVLTGPVGLVIAGIALVTVGTVALVNHLRQDAIPAVDLFGEATSEGTKKAVQGYMDLDDQASKSLMNLKLRGETVSKETADALIKNFEDMGAQIKAGMDKHYGESLKTMQDFFTKSSALSDADEAAVLATMNKKNEDQKKAVEEGQRQIHEILAKASAEGKALTADEQAKINEIQNTMKINAVKALSDTELESKSILERMKAQVGNITAEQAADVVKNSLNQKNKAVEDANLQYNETVKAIIKQRDEVGSISGEQAAKLIADAGRQKDEAVAKATEMNNKVVGQAKLQAGEQVSKVDWTTGEIKSKWQVLKEDTGRTFEAIGKEIGDTLDNVKHSVGTKAQEIGNALSNGFNSAINFITSLPNRAWQWGTDFIQGFINGINRMMEGVRRAVSNFSIPTIHVNIKWGGPGDAIPYPSFDVQWVHWNAEGGIFTRPTLLGGNQGVGEAGAEAVLPISKLDGIVANALIKASAELDRSYTNAPIVIQTMNVRSDDDIKRIAQELFRLNQNRQRSLGVLG